MRLVPNLYSKAYEDSTVNGPFVSHRISYPLIRNSVQGAMIMLPRSNALLRQLTVS